MNRPAQNLLPQVILAFIWSECNQTPLGKLDLLVTAPGIDLVDSEPGSPVHKTAETATLRAMLSTAIQDDTSQSWRQVIVTEIRLLTFRATREELAQLGRKHLIFGILCTWLVGIGRYWDNPRVGVLQHLGIGSVIYLFVFSLLLWLVLWPLRPKGCSYFKVLTFVSMVSPPAFLYAIPVEHFYSIDTANTINVRFLAIVAIWRVALLIFFLRRNGQMGPFAIIIATLLPLTFIVVSLSILNLEKVVFNLMGGLQDPSPADGSYLVLLALSYGSIFLFVPVVISYIVLSIVSHGRHVK